MNKNESAVCGFYSFKSGGLLPRLVWFVRVVVAAILLVLLVWHKGGGSSLPASTPLYRHCMKVLALRAGSARATL